MATNQNGNRCGNRSYRHPICWAFFCFNVIQPRCLRHSRSIAGVDVRPSRIPNAGCGLFAYRELQPGDVVIPYTGEVFEHQSPLQRQIISLCNHRDVPLGRTESPYAFKHIRMYGYIRVTAMHNGIVDASCLRGLAAYANTSRRPNVHVRQTTIRAEPCHPLTGWHAPSTWGDILVPLIQIQGTAEFEPQIECMASAGVANRCLFVKYLMSFRRRISKCLLVDHFCICMPPKELHHTRWL